jgi:hypothetical protein
MGGACSTNGEGEECVYIIDRKAKGKEATRRSRWWMDNIKMDLLEIGLD